MPRPSSRIQRLYDLLLRCYPAAFREEYGRDLRADFTRLWREERTHGKPALARLSLSVLVDTLATAAREHLGILRQDLRATRRSLVRTPAFTLGAIVTLALGIGATTAMFSVVHAVLLRPLPFPEADRLVELVETKPREGNAAYSVSAPDFSSWQERTRSFTAMAALWDRSIVLTDGIEPERVAGMAVSPNLWSVLEVTPLVGRTFDPSRDTPDDRVTLISDGLFQRRYAGDRELIGRAIHISGIPHTIIGVVPRELGFARDIDVWLPWVANSNQSRGDRQLKVIARLKPGVTLDQASSEVGGVAAALEREFPSTNQGYGARARPLLEHVVSPAIDRALLLLLAAAGLLLLVACANVANLVLTRALARGPELSLRRALGASTTRLARQVLTESLVLAAAGGACGVLAAAVAVRVSRTALVLTLPRVSELSLDVQTLAAACVATAVTGVACALVPAFRGTTGDLADGLRAGGRASFDRSHARFRQAFVVGQFCVATMLVTAAVLVAQSLQRLMDVDPGFRSDRLLVTSISLPARYANMQSRNVFYHQLIQALAVEPGVESVGMVSRTPLAPGGGSGMEVSTTAGSADSLQGERAHWRTATSNYFRTMGIPLVRGRLFDSEQPDKANGFRPLIVSESLARRLWPNGEDPIDRRVWLGNGQTRTVVGVVRDVHQGSLADGVIPTMYMPTSWVVTGTMALVVRTTGDPTSMARVVGDAVRRLDSEVPLFDVRTMENQIDRTTTQSRLNAGLLGAFALLALVLGLVGVASVVTHTVSMRRPELAVRMALGASASRVVREVATNGIKLCVYGVVAGLAASWAFGRAMSSLLFDVRANDPLILGGVALALFLVAVVACGLPALRVTRVDPAAVLHGE